VFYTGGGCVFETASPGGERNNLINFYNEERRRNFSGRFH